MRVTAVAFTVHTWLLRSVMVVDSDGGRNEGMRNEK